VIRAIHDQLLVFVFTTEDTEDTEDTEGTEKRKR
jgi:hypothetical protein